MAGRAVVIPAALLADEIAFAIAYLVACNPGRDLLITDREEFAGAIAGMVIERAENCCSGMRMEDLIAKQG
jgi:hypothetical protein